MVEELVFEVLAIDEVPLTSCVLVAPTITFSWEVNPFRMTELVAHEIEVATVYGSDSHEAYHFVQRHAAFDHKVVVTDHHVPIHFFVDETEDDSFIADESLVVAFCVCYCLFIGTTIGQLPEY